MSRPRGPLAGDDRGVTAVIGFILIFGILVITFSVYQAEVVPQQNSEVEFEQYQDVKEQMVELRSNIVLMQESTSTRSTAIDLGVRYPSRSVFVNPAPATSNLRTVGTNDVDVNVTINNAVAVRAESETKDFLNGTPLSYNTGVLNYEPDYNRFDGAVPTVYEHGLLHTRIDNGEQSVPITGQSLVDDTRINIISLNGTLSEGGHGTTSVDLEPISTRTRAIGAVNDTNDPITLEFASMMNATVWKETLEHQLVANGGHVRNVRFVSDGPGEFSVLELALERSQQYQFKMTKIGVGTGTTDTEAAYLTETEENNPVVQLDSKQRLTVEARDRFNGPQSGVTVTASAEGGSLAGNGTNVTGSDGRATFLYTANATGTQQVKFSIDSGHSPDSSHEPESVTNVTVTVTVNENSSTGGDGSDARVSVGQGGTEDYSEDSPSDTFSVSNGIWEGITCTDQLTLSEGQPASRPNANNLQGDIIRLTAFLNDSTGESYTIDIKLSRATDGSWNSKKVVVYDGNNNQNAELTSAAAAAIYESGETDILDISSYKRGPGSDFSDMLADIRALEVDSPVVWQTSRMTGRVNVTLACDPPPAPPASGVETVDGTTPSGEDSALKFDIQVGSGTSKTVTDIKLTRPGNQNSAVGDSNSKQLKRPNDREVVLTISDTSGTNQSGDLDQRIELDGTEYALDTNAVFSDGAVLHVDMGDIKNGNTKWTYNLVDSERDADAIVRFIFSDNTKFDAYLRVTNVNS